MVFLVLLSLTFFIGLITSQQLELPEGADCGDGWVCSKLETCSALGDLRISRPKICSFTENNPILCCPPKSSSLSTSKAAEMCQIYSSDQNICRLSVSFARRRRQLDLFNRPSVVGGHMVQPRTHRHMALIGFGEINKVEWDCGGSVISKDFVLSAAHCAISPTRQPARWVRVGDLDISTDQDNALPATHGISQRIIHPDYEEPAMYNDIALFRMDKPIRFNAWVGPACLATQAVLPYTRATVTGWGRTEFAGETSSHLLAVDVSLVSSTKCQQLLGKSRRMPTGINEDTMLCAGEEEGGKDACSGDSGGPLVVNTTTTCLKTQIGIISFGRMCALPNTPGVYTRVYHYIPWIESIVWP